MKTICKVVLFCFICCCCRADSYLIGAGSYDITGPAGDVNMMGYANPSQNAAGIHLRLRSRAFIVAEPEEHGNRFVYVNLDACMASQAVTAAVLSKLKDRFGDLYTEKNVALSGIHTHSGPGGYLQYVLYIVTSLGFVRQSFDAIVNGVVESIAQAHQNLSPGSVLFNEGELLDANINRSPSAYLNNPAEERSRYKTDVDKNMFLLKFVDKEKGPVATLNWFPVHCTSMNNTNTLISGDNKGAAARFMEDWFAQAGQVVGKSIDNPARRIGLQLKGGETCESGCRVRSLSAKPAFVAAFAQANVGDVSPNTLGAFCADTGLPCDFNRSTCNGRTELCIARGPGYPDHFASTRIIAERQLQKAKDLFTSANQVVTGKLAYRHAFVDFSQITVNLSPGNTTRTCPAAMGFSFAAGTTDGPGAFDFTQSDTKGNPFWKAVGGLLKKPSQEQVACQSPKPILLDTGDMSAPYAWAPAIIPIQILQLGQIFILSVPAEFTTMAGRRLKEQVRATLVEKSNGKYTEQNIRVVISGLTNTYSSYVTTPEEYQAQRYEGASTLYGPHTLTAYIQEFTRLATALAQDLEVETGPTPPNLIDKQLSFLPGVVVDSTPVGVKFGDLKQDVPRNSTFKHGDDVQAVFWSGCPRNDLMTEKSFAMVETSRDKGGSWTPVFDDDDWSLKFRWWRPFATSTNSFATVQWQVPVTAAPGMYRLRHFGAHKALLGAVTGFSGASSPFLVQ